MDTADNAPSTVRVHVFARFRAATVRALRVAGTRQHRDRTRQIVHYVEEGLMRDGFLARPEEQEE